MAFADGGVAIILENMLALSADQHSKVKQLNSEKIFPFHLNTVKSKAAKTVAIDVSQLLVSTQ
jgi:hypothetical protein